MDVEYRQRVSTPFREFHITDNEHYEDEVEFDHDTVDFCWVPKPDTARMTCYVKLFDAQTLAELTNANGELVVNANDTQRQWMSFSGFGWHDAAMTMPITRCRYEAWIDGTASIVVEMFV
ncbi:MAG: hypothetical protein ACRD29_04980 [Acidimicrobiales bacterium]